MTGAARGINRAIDLALAEAGADVSIAARNEASLRLGSAEIKDIGRRAVAIPTDVLRQERIEAGVLKATRVSGRLDFPVNCAGTEVPKPLVDTTVEEYGQQMDLHHVATVIAYKVAVPIMQKQGGGKIVGVSSILCTVGHDHHSANSPGKGAMDPIRRSYCPVTQDYENQTRSV